MFSIPDYMPEQRVINPRMRAMVVDWLVSVQLETGISHESLYSAVKTMDLYLAK
jgi:hypothetical protein